MACTGGNLELVDAGLFYYMLFWKGANELLLAGGVETPSEVWFLLEIS